jgi:hypothetical protein
MRRRSRVLVSVVALGAVAAAVLGLGVAPVGAQTPDVGFFSSPFAPTSTIAGVDYSVAPPDSGEQSKEFPAAVSIVALPNGKFLYWGGLEGLEDAAWPLTIDGGRVLKTSRSRLLDLSDTTPSFLAPSPEDGGAWDMFCADQRLLLNQNVIAAGGTRAANDPVDLTPYTGETGPGGYAELFGVNASRIYKFNSSGGDWVQGNSLNHGRWYPTILTLPNGKLFIASGTGRLTFNDKVTNVHETETFDPYVAGAYDPVNGSWTDNGASAEQSLPLFSRLHLLANGKILYPAVGQMFNPYGQSYDEALWNVMKLYDPVAKTWSDAGIGPFGAVGGAPSILLPFKPNTDGSYTTSRVLVAGGVLGTTPGTYVAQKLTQLITVEGDDVTAERGPDLNNARWYSSGVIGPTGEVFLFNGADKDEVDFPGTEKAVHTTEVYDPVANTWTELASSARDRTYHNSAILMADGRILVGGHSPINTLYGPGQSATGDNNYLHRAAPDQFANNFKDPSFEIFTPPYLSPTRGARPVISSVSATIEWGTLNQPVQVDIPGAVTKVVLIHMPAATHITDADMRAIELPIQSRSSGAVFVNIPDNHNVAIPGYYYLFAVADHGSGPIPSTAAIVRIGDSTVLPSGSVARAVIPEYRALSAKPTTRGAVAPAAGSASVVSARQSAPASSRTQPGSLAIALSIGAAAFGAAFVGLRRPRRSRA